MILQMNLLNRLPDQIEQLKKSGLDIQHIQRVNRKGFKAGALKEGLVKAKGEFIAIFDADFLPKKDWLKQTIPYFKDEKIGVVQTRWSHINRNYSILTQNSSLCFRCSFYIRTSWQKQQRTFYQL